MTYGTKEFEVLYRYIVACGFSDYDFGSYADYGVFRYCIYDGVNKLVATRNKNKNRMLYCFVHKGAEDFTGPWGHMMWNEHQKDVPDWFRPYVEKVKDKKFIRVIRH